jgi:hypothetical protein
MYDIFIIECVDCPDYEWTLYFIQDIKKNGNGPPSVGVEPTYHIGHRKPEVIYYITEI